MGSRSDACGVDTLNLLRVLKYVGELLHEQIFFRIAELEARKRRDPINVGASQPFRHAKCYHAGMVALRRAAVAGSWYPADPEALARDVDRHLAAVTRSPSGDPLAIIAPHAGLMYSGPVAAHAYSLLRGRDIDVAILVGPSHYVGFEGIAIYERGAFETPFGPIPIAEDCASDLAMASRLVKAYPAAHAREHSLEMQLPFLKRVLPNASIVPLVMGYQHREIANELGDAIRTAAIGRRVLIVASTDLSHYQNATTAGALDDKVIRRVLDFDADGLMSLLETNPQHACGGGPTVSVMRAAKALGAKDARVLKYGDSGDVSGDKNAVVGYLAAAFGTFAPDVPHSIAPNESR